MARAASWAGSAASGVFHDRGDGQVPHLGWGLLVSDAGERQQPRSGDLRGEGLAVLDGEHRIGGAVQDQGGGRDLVEPGVGLALSNDIIMSSVQPARAGQAAATSETAYELGMTLGTAVLGGVLVAWYTRVVSAEIDAIDAIDLPEPLRERASSTMAEAQLVAPSPVRAVLLRLARGGPHLHLCELRCRSRARTALAQRVVGGCRRVIGL